MFKVIAFILNILYNVTSIIEEIEMMLDYPLVDVNPKASALPLNQNNDPLAGRPPINKLMIQVSMWRDDAQGIGDKVVRRVVCGFALAGLSIAALIDGVGSLALAILTTPTLIVGSNLPFNLAKRAVTEVGSSICGVTVYQITNIFCDIAIMARPPVEKSVPNLEDEEPPSPAPIAPVEDVVPE